MQQDVANPLARVRDGELFAQTLQPLAGVEVEGGEEQRPLVGESLVKAAARKPGPLDEIDHRGAVIAALAEHLQRVAHGVVEIEFARPPGGGAAGGGRVMAANMEPIGSEF